MACLSTGSPRFREVLLEERTAAANERVPDRGHAASRRIGSSAPHWTILGSGQTAATSGSRSLSLDPSAERERERLHTGIEELDLELSLGDRSRLSNQLIQALLGDRAVTLLICITSMA